MIGDFIARILVLLLGYAYPAFECFKTVEKNKVDLEELRFWCQYWIIVALLTACERLGDIFLSWIPMYGEAKLAFVIYLWYPKTKGTGYIYENLLKPYVAKHETDIDRKLLEMKARAWDFAIYYWQNCAQLGQTTFFQVLQYLANQSGKFTGTFSEMQKGNDHAPSAPPPPPPSELHPTSNNNGKWSPTAPPSPRTTANRAVSDSPKSARVQAHFNSYAETIRAMDGGTESHDKLHEARMRLRRSKPI